MEWNVLRRPDMAPNDDPRTPLGTAQRRSLRRGRVLLAGTLALAGAILVLVFGLSRPKIIYSLRVSEFMKRPQLTTVRLDGVLVRRSLCKVPSKCEYWFRLTDRIEPSSAPQHELAIRYEQCVIPDTFRDVAGYELNVVVVGELHDDGRHFDAAQIMAKCPSKFEVPKDPALIEAFRRPVPPCASKTASAH